MRVTLCVLLTLTLTGCVAYPSRNAEVGNYLSEFYLWDAQGRCIHVLSVPDAVFKIVPETRCVAATTR
jgi:hypothetical protein